MSVCCCHLCNNDIVIEIHLLAIILPTVDSHPFYVVCISAAYSQEEDDLGPIESSFVTGLIDTAVWSTALRFDSNSESTTLQWLWSKL